MSLADRIAAAKTVSDVRAAFGKRVAKVRPSMWVCPQCRVQCLKPRIRVCQRCRDEEIVREAIIALREIPTLRAVAEHLGCRETTRLARALRAVLGSIERG